MVERPEIGFLLAALDGGVFTVVESCRDNFVLILVYWGGAITMQSIFQNGVFFLTLVADTLEAAGMWVVRRRLRGIGIGCHC